MYTSLSIKNFRAFQTLEIEGLKRVNLFTGRNNSGKTSVLEAVYLLEGEAPAARSRQLFSNRGLDAAGVIHKLPTEMPWATLFRDLDVANDIQISGRRGNELATVLLTTQPTQHDRSILSFYQIPRKPSQANLLMGRRTAPAGGDGDYIFVTDDGVHQSIEDEQLLARSSFLLAGEKRSQHELVELFSPLVVNNQVPEVLDVLRIIDPRLRGLSIVLSGGRPVLHAELEGASRQLPIAVVGDGMLRLLDILFAVLQHKGRAVMIDEIENGFHYSTLPKVWELIHKLAKQYNVQVFAVTHSQECAIAAHEAAKATGYDYRYLRVEQQNGIGRAVAYSPEQMETSIEMNLEVR